MSVVIFPPDEAPWCVDDNRIERQNTFDDIYVIFTIFAISL